MQHIRRLYSNWWLLLLVSTAATISPSLRNVLLDSETYMKTLWEVCSACVRDSLSPPCCAAPPLGTYVIDAVIIAFPVTDSSLSTVVESVLEIQAITKWFTIYCTPVCIVSRLHTHTGGDQSDQTCPQDRVGVRTDWAWYRVCFYI